MSDTEKIIQVNIPAEIQERIDKNELKLIGTQVRDARGRIVCNLTSLERPQGLSFSPNITVNFENCAFISGALIAPSLQDALDAQRKEFLSNTLKINRVLENQKNDLVAAVAKFDATFQVLLNGSSLISQSDAFSSGLESATLLASHLGSYVQDYIDSTTVYHHRATETYQEYKHGTYLRPPIITRRKFESFTDHQANFFAYSFLQILNKINIISMCYDRKILFNYFDNLDALEKTLVEALNFVMYEMGNEGDIYQMCYRSIEGNAARSGVNDVRLERIKKYDKVNDWGSLIARSSETGKVTHYDPERLSSIEALIDILEDIANLRQRALQFNGVQLDGLSELAAIRRLLFKDPD